MSTLAYLAMGVDEVQRLSCEQGLDLDLTLAEIIGLGRTVYDRERATCPPPHLDPIGTAILLQIEADRSRDHAQVLAHDQAQDQANDQVYDVAQDALSNTPKQIEYGSGERRERGQGRLAVREVSNRHVRNGKNDRPAIRDYPDEKWS